MTYRSCIQLCSVKGACIVRRFVVTFLTVAVLLAAVLPLAARAEEKKEIKL